MLNVPLSYVVMNPTSGERVCVHHPKIRESYGISSLSSQAIEHKSRNQKVPQIWSKVLDIRATLKPFYHLVSILKPTDSEQVDERDRPKTQIVCQNPPFGTVVSHTRNRKQKQHLGNHTRKLKIKRLFLSRGENNQKYSSSSDKAFPVLFHRNHGSTGCKRIGLQIIHRNYFELQPISHLAIITPFKETYTTRQLYLHLVYINQQKLNCTHILCNSRN